MPNPASPNPVPSAPAPAAPTPAARPASTPAPASVPIVARPARATPTPVSTIPSRDDRGRFAEGRPIRQQRVTAKKAFGAAASGQSVVDTARERLKNQVSAPVVSPERPAPPALPEVMPPAVPELEAAPAVPAAPAKYKVGEEEFTPEELQARLKELRELKSAPPAPVEAAALEPDPVRDAAPAPTKEEIAQREAEFIQTTSAALDAPLTEAEVDTLLGGGKEAVAMMTNLRKRDMATAILQARKGIAEGLNPVLQEIFKGLAPLAQQHEQLQRYNITQQFVSKHKDFAPHLDLATNIAEELLKRYPEQASRLTPDQFIDEVARQTDVHLSAQFKRFNPQSAASWRTAGQTPATPPAPAAQPPPPPAPRPLAATVPQGSPTTGRALDWQASTARALR